MNANFKFKVGETVTMPVPIYSRWWQFWKPRVTGYEARKYTIVENFESDGVWSRGVIEP